MTEQEAWSYIRYTEDELVPLNVVDDFEILVAAVPFEVRDERGVPTGEWDVHVGWRCWAVRDGEPHEYGRALGVNSPTMLAGDLYRMLSGNVVHTMGTDRTYRNYDDAVLLSGDDRLP